MLLVGSAMGGGGAETRFRLLATHLFGGTADVAVLKDGGRDNLRREQAFTVLGWGGPRSYPDVLRRLRTTVRERHYDAILAVGLYPNTLAWAAVKGLGAQRPALILTEITRPVTESRLGGRMRHTISHAVRWCTYPGADLTGANSQDGLEEVVRHFRVQRARIRRLPNLAEPEKLAALAAAGDGTGAVPASSGLRSLCAVARLDPLKRIDTLIEAAAELPPELPWHIDVLGDGPDRARLEEIITHHGLAERVHLHGWCQNPYPAMRAATATVLTSTYEGFSNTVLESMLLGTPVITSYCSTDARLMCEEGAALGFPVGDAKALTRQLLAILTDDALRNRLATTASRYALNHTLANALPGYEALVLDAVALRKARGKSAPRGTSP